jgi:Four helix bundle sensory module for signal transduction
MIVIRRMSSLLLRPSWKQVGVSILIAGLGLMGARALSQVNQDITLMYTEYTLGATELAHISADVIRFRTTIIRSLEAQTKQDFERITVGLPEQRAHIQHAIDRYAAASLRVSRSGRSEVDDLRAVKDSLDDYFQAASKTVTLMTQMWTAATPQEATALRHQAEVQAADNSGPKLIQFSLALDRLLETIADVAKDLRDEGVQTLRDTSSALVLGSFLIALLNLFMGRLPETARPVESPAPGSGNGKTAARPHRMEKEYADPALRQN